MDALTYHYNSGTNRLNYVADAHGQVYDNDYAGGTSGNFTYNEIGELTSDAAEEIQEIKWNVYGKVKEIIRTPDSERPDLEFRYDPFGNRIAKIEKPRATNGDPQPAEYWVYTHYARDASSNTMAVYKTSHPDVAEKEFVHSLEEQYLYGSKRLGIVNKLTQLHTHEYTGSFTGLADMVVNSSQAGVGFGGVITAPPTLEPVAGVQLSLTAGGTVLGSVQEGDITYSDGLHQLCGQINSHDDYDTLHTGLSNEIMILSTNFSNDNELVLSYSTPTDDHYSVSQASNTPKIKANHEFGHTQYELTNHLGNVQTTISNRFLFGDSTEVKWADIYTYSDFYPYGFEKPLRNYNLTDYSQSFNGMYKDDEIKGVGNTLDFGARIQNSRLGVWLSRDPLESKYPDISPYVFVGGNPIYFYDADGRDLYAFSEKSKGTVLSAIKLIFGDDHNFSFQGNKLTYFGNGTASNNDKQYLLKVFNDWIVNNPHNHVFVKEEGFVVTGLNGRYAPSLYFSGDPVARITAKNEGFADVEDVDEESTSTIQVGKNSMTTSFIKPINHSTSIGELGIYRNREMLFWHSMGHAISNYKFMINQFQPIEDNPNYALAQKETVSFENFVAQILGYRLRDGSRHGHGEYFQSRGSSNFYQNQAKGYNIIQNRPNTGSGIYNSRNAPTPYDRCVVCDD